MRVRWLRVRWLAPVALALSLGCQGAGPANALDGGRSASGAPREQVVRVPTPEPPTLDPGLATDGHSIDLIYQLFEGLVGFDEQGNVFGVQAQAWQAAEDGRTYTFQLR